MSRNSYQVKFNQDFPYQKISENRLEFPCVLYFCTMKHTLLFILFSYFTVSAEEFKRGFNASEAKDMIAICNSYTFLDLYHSDSEILPKGYNKTYTSRTLGMDNKYQIYQKGTIGVINIRGSTDKSLSWMENFYASMIPAKGVIKTPDYTFNYCFARDTSAAVHAGYALGIAFLSKDILHQLKELNKQGIFNIIITGHSQGGALAHLLCAYLENSPNSIVSKKNTFKTYAFADPMTGNKAFVDEYNSRFCTNQTSFSIINPDDFVPTLPMSYNAEGNFISPETISSLFFDRTNFDFKQLAMDFALKKLEKTLSGYLKYASHALEKRISETIGDVIMPTYLEDINYKAIENRIELPSFEYPKILKDSTILSNDSLMTIYKRDLNGVFYEKSLYKKEPMRYQHKPYNYYVAILKKYFKEEYEKLNRNYLPENL